MPEIVTLGNLLIDPNIIYVLLVFGLWLFVTALYLPGTGVIEIGAGVVLLITVLLLAAIPTTNWWAVLLLIIGVLGFMILPFLRDKRLERLALAGLALQAAGALFLFRDGMIHPLLIALTVIAPLGYHLWVLTPILENLRELEKQPKSEEVSLIGARGRVVQQIEGVGKAAGTVQVRGELWSAQAHEALPTGTPIAVIDTDGLLMMVEAVKEKRRAHTDALPPNSGAYEEQETV